MTCLLMGGRVEAFNMARHPNAKFTRAIQLSPEGVDQRVLKPDMTLMRVEHSEL